MSHNIPKDQNGTINIVFLDDGSIKNLNNKYRKKNESTDVLSFHYHDDFSQLEGSDIAWEIILSEAYIVSQWIEYQLGSEKEFYKLIIHSILHILWYDHEEDHEFKIMNNFEKIVWEKVFE